MKRIAKGCALAITAALLAVSAFAQDRLAYETRVAERFHAMFTWLDADKDGKVTRREAQGAIEFIDAFDDMDIDRDDAVSAQELERYLKLRQAR
jgi:Ca2+-binding EF-hand superfamily protein